jgi:hypothetical protein
MRPFLLSGDPDHDVALLSSDAVDLPQDIPYLSSRSTGAPGKVSRKDGRVGFAP